jgi:hypothetical protein
MLKQFAIAVLLSGSTLAQSRAPEPHSTQLDEIRKIECKVPLGFGCAILFDVGFGSDNVIASVFGGVVRQISVILDERLYTIVYDPPLERDDRLRRRSRVAARVEGDYLIVRWRDGTETKGRIIGREQIDPNRPQPS